MPAVSSGQSVPTPRKNGDRQHTGRSPSLLYRDGQCPPPSPFPQRPRAPWWRIPPLHGRSAPQVRSCGMQLEERAGNPPPPPCDCHSMVCWSSGHRHQARREFTYRKVAIVIPPTTTTTAPRGVVSFFPSLLGRRLGLSFISRQGFLGTSQNIFSPYLLRTYPSMGFYLPYS